jgi:cell division protein FtsW
MLKKEKDSGLFNRLMGDKTIWAMVALLAIFSFLPVYSASSNLAYLGGQDGNTFVYLIKHFFHLAFGLLIMFAVHKIPYRYYRGLSILLIPVVVLLLIFTLAQGVSVQGSYASRWIQLPIVNMSFQTSEFAGLILMIYVARYIAKKRKDPITFKASLLHLWLPVFLIVGLILPANLSTALILFSMIVLLLIIGGYSMRYLSIILVSGIVMLSIFGLTAKAFPGLFPNRVDTWISRIESFTDSKSEKEQYQVEKAKIAIATGGITGNGIGKSVQRNFLPQSSSDFIYAIIVEEMGLIGGIGVLLVYLILMFRIAIIVTNANSMFAKLLVIAVGVPVVFQAFINIGVAVNLFPVTGQTLPLVSSGGTSIWMTCVAFGIVQSVAARKGEVKSENDKEESPINEFGENPLDVLSEAQ